MIIIKAQKIPKSPQSFKEVQFSPWRLSLKKLHIWPFDFQDCYFWSLWRYFGRYGKGNPSTINKLQKRSLDNIWEVGSKGPNIFGKYKFGPLVNNRILYSLNPKSKINKHKPFSTHWPSYNTIPPLPLTKPDPTFDFYPVKTHPQSQTIKK